jgi:tetratricopeptide (TPR) repeat protein
MSIAALVAVAGCTSSSSTPPPRTSAEPTLEQRRALALAVPKESEELQRAAKAVREAPELAERWVVLGQLWVRHARRSNDPGHSLSAEAAATVALSIQPDLSSALGLEALVALNQHRFADAKALAQKALKLREDDQLALAALADATLELGDLDTSTATVQRMVDLKPSLASYGRAAHLRWMRGDVAGAQSLYRQALDAGRNPKDPEPQAWMAVQSALIFFELGDVEGAEAGFRFALGRLQGFPPALTGLARVQLSRGDAAAAIPLLEQALAASPLVETWVWLAEARAVAGDTEGSRTAWAEAERVGRLSDGLALGRAWAEAKEHRDEALALLQAERANRPNAQVEGALAWAHFRAGHLELARTGSERALSSGAVDVRLRYQHAAILAASGERARAKEQLTALAGRFSALSPRQQAEARSLLETLDREVAAR